MVRVSWPPKAAQTVSIFRGRHPYSQNVSVESQGNWNRTKRGTKNYGLGTPCFGCRIKYCVSPALGVSGHCLWAYSASPTNTADSSSHISQQHPTQDRIASNWITNTAHQPTNHKRRSEAYSQNCSSARSQDHLLTTTSRSPVWICFLRLTFQSGIFFWAGRPLVFSGIVFASIFPSLCHSMKNPMLTKTRRVHSQSIFLNNGGGLYLIGRGRHCQRFIFCGDYRPFLTETIFPTDKS